MEDYEKGEKAKLREQREKRNTASSGSAYAGSTNLTVNGTAGSNSSLSPLSGTAIAGRGKEFRSQLQERRGQHDRHRDDKRMLTTGFRQVRTIIINILCYLWNIT